MNQDIISFSLFPALCYAGGRQRCDDDDDRNNGDPVQDKKYQKRELSPKTTAKLIYNNVYCFL